MKNSVLAVRVVQLLNFGLLTDFELYWIVPLLVAANKWRNINKTVKTISEFPINLLKLLIYLL